MTNVTRETLDRIRQHLDELPPVRKLRPYDVVAALTEEMAETRRRGYSMDDLIEMLGAVGIRLTRSTLRNYISRARSERRKAAARTSETLRLICSDAAATEPQRHPGVDDEQTATALVGAYTTPTSQFAIRACATPSAKFDSRDDA